MNATAEAPVRPKNTRNATEALEAVTSVPAQHNEAEELQALALHILNEACADLLTQRMGNIAGALHAASEASDIAYSLHRPEDSDTEPPTSIDGLVLICHHLTAAEAHLEAATGDELPGAISAAVMLGHAQQFARRLHAAITGLPGSLEDLRALTTYSGAKPFRDRPTPPIRRDPAAALEPGQLSRAQLQLFMQQLAGGLGTVNQTLQMAQTSDEDWQRQRLLDAAQLMTQSLGAIADHASGSTICGSIGDWICGPFFNELGDAA